MKHVFTYLARGINLDNELDIFYGLNVSFNEDDTIMVAKLEFNKIYGRNPTSVHVTKQSLEAIISAIEK